MAGLPFQNLPKDNPQDVLGRDLQSAQKRIADQYNMQLSRIRKTPMSDRDFANHYNKLAGSFKNDMQRISQPFQQKEQQLRTIRQLVQQGHITQDRGNEAMWRMVLPQETERAMFTRDSVSKPSAPLSPTQLASYGESAAEFVEPARETDRFWGPIPKPYTLWHKFSKENLIDQYKGWQENIGYTNLSPVRQRQVDIQWDDYVKGQGIKEWDPKDPKVRALRSKGRLATAAAPNITPMSRAIIQSKAERSKTLSNEIAQQILEEAGGDNEKARQIARSRGYSL